MSQRIEVELDDRGRLVIPRALREQLGLVSGATVVIEDETADVAYVRVQPEQSRLVDKGGVLVVQAEFVGDLLTVVADERDGRVQELHTTACSGVERRCFSGFGQGARSVVFVDGRV